MLTEVNEVVFSLSLKGPVVWLVGLAIFILLVAKISAHLAATSSPVSQWKIVRIVRGSLDALVGRNGERLLDPAPSRVEHEIDLPVLGNEERRSASLSPKQTQKMPAPRSTPRQR